MNMAAEPVGIDRSTTGYLLLHYAILLLVIFLIVAYVELHLGSVPLWLGLLIAILVGLLYPTAVRRLGLEPERWEA